jgi:hypothetical protein
MRKTLVPIASETPCIFDSQNFQDPRLQISVTFSMSSSGTDVSEIYVYIYLLLVAVQRRDFLKSTDEPLCYLKTAVKTSTVELYSNAVVKLYAGMYRSDMYSTGRRKGWSRG